MAKRTSSEPNIQGELNASPFFRVSDLMLCNLSQRLLQMHAPRRSGLPGNEAGAAIGQGPAALPCDLPWGAHMPSEAGAKAAATKGRRASDRAQS